MTYRAKAASRMTGIPRQTLLAWERRYGLVQPARNESGYRLYTDEDVELLLRVKGRLDEGHPISQAIDLVRRERTSAPDPEPALGGSEIRAALLERLLAFDRAGAEEVRRRFAPLSFRATLDEVWLPLLRDVGIGWENGQVTVAQEHFVSAFCREQLGMMLHALDCGPESGPSVICAGWPGERHELGLLAAAVKLALHGLRVTYLGADLPIAETSRVARELGVQGVCMSVVMRRSAARVLAVARAIRADLPPRTLLAIGGIGAVGLENEPGIHFGGDAQALVAAMEELGRTSGT